MTRLTFRRDTESVDLLDNILYSYSGWERGTVMSETKSMTVLLVLLECQAIQATEHPYFFRHDIRDDLETMSAYQELAQKTRWKQYGEREIIRLNALYQLRHLGTPDYQDYIQYRDGSCEALCGNISPSTLLIHLAAKEHLRQFYIFSYPYWNESHTAAYYRFAFTPRAVEGAKRYRESVWDAMRAASKANSVFPEIPTTQEKI